MGTYEQLLPQRLLAGHFSSYNKDLENEPEWIKNAFYTRIYGIDPDSELFSRFGLSVTKEAVDKERFSKGKEIILLVPMYLLGDTNINKKRFSDDEVISATNEGNRMRWLFDRSGTYKITYNSRYNKYYDLQEDVNPGDTICLS